MDLLISVTAQGGLVLIAVAALALWVTLPRTDRIRLALTTVIGLLTVFVLIKVGSAVHTDPRPFVVDPSLKPLFAHPPDNGFPSDHTATGVVVGLAVLSYRRWLGAALVAVALLVGAARVAAHVHHVQDVAGGAAIGLVAAIIALVISRLLTSRLSRRVGRRALAR
jgi:undecaprenyl-diphosphatase